MRYQWIIATPLGQSVIPSADRAQRAGAGRNPAGLSACAAFAACAILALGVLAALSYARALEWRAMDTLAPMQLHQKDVGAALQVEAFLRSDLLPVYGASELNSGGSDRAVELFKDAPTGFRVSPNGEPGSSFITYLQALAAVGPDLRGKKVVISSTPSVLIDQRLDPASYAGNFSRLQANALTFSPQLSFDLKQQAARRLLQYPQTLRDEPVMLFALERLAGGSAVDRLLYALSWPLGELRALVLRCQDHVETVLLIRRQASPPEPSATQQQPLDWAQLAATAEQEQRLASRNNRYGFDAPTWRNAGPDLLHHPKSRTDRAFLHAVGDSNGWTDLELLLRALHELGAESIVLTTPLPGPYYDAIGISPIARASYYQRLQQLSGRYGVPVYTFADHDEDRTFFRDRGAHPTAPAWVVMDRTLDAFYHGGAGQVATSDPSETNSG